MNEHSQLIPSSPSSTPVPGYGAMPQRAMQHMGDVSPTSTPETTASKEYAHFLDKPVAVTPAQCELGYSPVGKPVTRKRRCRSCISMCCKIFSNRMRRSCSVRALFISAIGGAVLMATAAVGAMSKLTNGLSLQTMLSNIMAGAASSETGLAVGGGVGLTALFIVGCVWWCGSSCRLLCKSPDERFLHFYKKAVDSYKALLNYERSQGALPADKASYKTYLSGDYIASRTAECKNILLARNASEDKMAEYGFVPIPV